MYNMDVEFETDYRKFLLEDEEDRAISKFFDKKAHDVKDDY